MGSSPHPDTLLLFFFIFFFLNNILIIVRTINIERKLIVLNCGSTNFPDISKLLKMLCTLAISIATLEKTFLTLRRVKI